MNKKHLFLSVLYLLLLISFTRCSTYSEIPHKTIQHELDSLITNFDGTAGVYVRNLETGETFEVNADTLFPTASIIKIPIAIGIFKKINQGSLNYHQKLVYRDSMAHGGSGLMQYFKDSTKITLNKVISLMLSRSDNTASIWCQKLAGGSKAINKWLANHGFRYTRDNSGAPVHSNGVPGRKRAYKKYGWGQTTPREMATLLVIIRQGNVISPAASERLYRALSRTYWDEYALFQIPPTVHVASKQGMVNTSRSEVVLVDAPSGAYVYFIGTKNNDDQSWELTNEAWQLARDISALLWHYFNPKSNWNPPEGAKKYWPNTTNEN